MDGEGALDADAEGDLTDREGLRDATSLACDDDALEDLDAGTGSLNDLDVDLEGVPGRKEGTSSRSDAALISSIRFMILSTPMPLVRSADSAAPPRREQRRKWMP